MKRSTDKKSAIYEAFLTYLTFVLDYPDYLSRTDMVFDGHPERGYITVSFFLIISQFSPTGLFMRLKCSPSPGITLISGILKNIGCGRKEIAGVCDNLVVGLSTEHLTHEDDGIHNCCDNTILQGMGLLLSAIVLRLCYGSGRTWHGTLGCIMIKCSVPILVNARNFLDCYSLYCNS